MSIRSVEQIGRDVTLDNLLQEVLKDEVFFRLRRRSHPLRGEVLMQAGFAARFPAPAPVGIRTAIETAGDSALTAFAGGRSL